MFTCTCNLYRNCGTSKHSTITVTSMSSQKYGLPLSIRQFKYKDIQINKECVLGMGAFGKCTKARIAHLDVCAKFFRTGVKYEWSFSVEAFLLLKCCHENLPWIYGIVGDPKIILTSLHTYENTAFTLHSALHDKTPAEITVNIWKRILYDVLLAVEHLHDNKILHNDIKNNNILIEKSPTGQIRGILIDLGKGCLIDDAKRYTITDDSRRRDHKRRYPHIAPDLIDGYCKQSTGSDVYSVGRVVLSINSKLSIPALNSLSEQCSEYMCTKRPTIINLKTFLFNLFDYK